MSGSSAVQAVPVGGLAANLVNFWFKPGIAGGQVGFGGTAAGDVARFQGASAAAAPDVGRVEISSPLEITYAEGNTTPAEQTALRWRQIFTTAGAYIGGPIAISPTITYTNSFYIYSTINDTSVHISNAPAGFQAWVLFQALSRITNGTSSDLVQAIVMNDGVVHERSTAGASTAGQHITIGANPQLRTLAAGATMSWTAGFTGMRVAATFSTVALSTINFGPIRGVWCIVPSTALFQPGLGVETATEITGLYYENMAFGGNITKRAVFSAQAAATNAYVIHATGTARSEHGGDFIIPRDTTGFLLGIDQDVRMFWAAAGFWALQFNSAGGASGFDDQFRISNPAADRFEVSAALAASEIGFVFNKGSFGEGGAAGNNKWRFVAQAETVTIGGGYAQFLLTQAANDTIDAALSQYFAWALNAPTPTIGTGSIVDGGALLIGGNISSGTNRYGVLILSNPTGGTLNYALRLPNGDARFDARVDINNPIALGGGAAATLGTIGGAGPAAAAQAIWVEIDVGGVPTWFAGWR